MALKKPVEDHCSAAEFLPEKKSLSSLKKAAERCKGCPLYKDATQTVFGVGPKGAKLLFIGEEPGDAEDKQGEPFVGPAGRLLDRALQEAGIVREQCYLTNAVKHFKFEWKGKHRLHKKPRQIEVEACYPWLEEEIKQVKPELIVCLGATAAQAMLGKNFRITKQRGHFFKSALAPYIVATVHPSSILRARDDQSRHEEMRLFVEDLKEIARAVRHGVSMQ